MLVSRETRRGPQGTAAPIALGTDMIPFEPQDGTTATVVELEHYAAVEG
jgi:hypothetical protein